MAAAPPTLPASAPIVAEAETLGLAVDSAAFAAALDAGDALAGFRGRVHFPRAAADGRAPVYLCGNSLGLQPVAVRQAVCEDLDRWAALGVEGHFEDDSAPGAAWWTIEDCAEAEAAELVGAEPGEVVVMNSLTVNLHLLLAAFYRPRGRRTKILVEAGAFPSDEYAVQSLLRNRGLDPASDLVRVAGDSAALCAGVRALGEECALVLVGAVQYYSGEWFDARALAEAAHEVGALLGLDCAHAAGNVPLRLHADGVDFACWCSYKYLNSGPGALAGAFVHGKHDTRQMAGALRGWWGHARATRFEMAVEPKEYRAGAAGLQLSNPPTLPMVALREAYKLHAAAGMGRLRAKSVRLTAYLELLLARRLPGACEVLTPRDPARRGAQLSLLFRPPTDVDAVMAKLRARHVFVDLRRPDVIRVAPAPLYNSFADARAFVDCLAEALQEG